MGFIVEKGPVDDLDSLFEFDKTVTDFDDEFGKLFKVRRGQMSQLIEMDEGDDKDDNK